MSVPHFSPSRALSRVGLTAVAAAAVLLAGCAFTSAQEERLRTAIALQDDALVDQRFASIMRELDSAGAIDWNNRLDRRAAAEASAYPRPVEWLLARFRQDGGLARAQLLAWRKWNPLSSTTAATIPHTVTRLNLWRFSSDQLSLANTLVHERTHFFGVVHPGRQTRAANRCDPAYVAGDLSEALAATRSGGVGGEKTAGVCPALCTAIAAHGLWSPCAA